MRHPFWFSITQLSVAAADFLSYACYNCIINALLLERRESGGFLMRIPAIINGMHINQEKKFKIYYYLLLLVVT